MIYNHRVTVRPEIALLAASTLLRALEPRPELLLYSQGLEVPDPGIRALGPLG